MNKNKTFKDVYGWGASSAVEILKNREYLGHTVNFKTRKHFKDKKSHYVPKDEWTIFENTHEPIIDQPTFDLVQKIRGNVRRYPDSWDKAAHPTGLLYCALRRQDVCPPHQQQQAHFTIACRGICCEHTTAANCAAYEELCSLYGKTSDCLITMCGAGLESDH